MYLIQWQSQFLLSGSQGNGQWAIPLTLCCGSYDTCKRVLFSEKFETIGWKELLGSSITESRFVETGAWIKLNVDQTGFYRVKYDEDLAGRLRCAIETKCLSATDRFGNSITRVCTLVSLHSRRVVNV